MPMSPETFTHMLKRLGDAEIKDASFGKCGLDEAQLRQVAKTLSRPTVKGKQKAANVITANFSENGWGATEMSILAPAFKKNRLTQLDLHGNALDGDAIGIVFDALRKPSVLTHADLSGNPLGDAGAAKLVEFVLAHAPDLTNINLENAGIGDDGALALAALIERSPKLVKLKLQGNPIGAAGMAALEEVIVDDDHKNLVDVVNGNGDDGNLRIKDHCAENLIRATALQRQAAMFSELEPGDPQEWWETAQRHTAITKGTNVTSSRWKYDAFLKGLPVVNPEAHESAADWAAALTEPQGAFAAIDNPATWENLGATLTELHARGIHLRSDALLDAEGNASPLLQRAVDYGMLPALFTHENWEGASKQELQSVIQALPENAADAIPNRQQLLAAASRHTRATGQGR